MQAHSGTVTLSEKLQRTRIICTKPECTANCAYALNCYKHPYRWIFVGIWLTVALALLSVAVAIV